MLQCFGDFQSNKVVGLLESVFCLITLAESLRPDHYKEHVGVSQRLFDVLAEIHAGGNRTEIHEDIAFTKLRF